jgi:hypothetical protein
MLIGHQVGVLVILCLIPNLIFAIREKSEMKSFYWFMVYFILIMIINALFN